MPSRIDRSLPIAALIAGVPLLVALLHPSRATSGCDLEAGRRVFMKCRPCHAVERGVPHGVGPGLHGVIGRQAGRAAGFRYSGPFRQVDFVWSRESLDLYLQDPARFIGSNWMPFGGLKRAEDRRAVICYLEEAARQ